MWLWGCEVGVVILVFVRGLGLVFERFCYRV